MKVGRKMTGNKEEATKMIYVGKSCREICKLIIKNENKMFKICRKWTNEQLILKGRSPKG